MTVVSGRTGTAEVLLLNVGDHKSWLQRRTLLAFPCALPSSPKPTDSHGGRENELLRCFQAFDVNCNGKVDVSELLLLGMAFATLVVSCSGGELSMQGE